MSMERWIAGMRAKDNPDAVKAGEELRKKYGDIAPAETKPLVSEFRPFTDQEKEILNNGAVILSLDPKETIEDQRKIGRLFDDDCIKKVIAEGGDKILKRSSAIAEIAIYPENFFIPDSNNKSLPEQKELAKKEGEKLRKKLGSKGDSLDIIIPDRASIATQMIFKYLDMMTKAGKKTWLFGPDYGQHVSARTKDALDEFGIVVADVGDVDLELGVSINSWKADEGNPEIYVVRLIVARKNRLIK